jgi:hypothetical protein
MLMRRCGDRRHVLHLHGDGAWTFAPDQARVAFEFGADAGAGSGRIVADLHAKPAEHMIGEHAVGPVDALRQQYVIAGLEQGEVDQRDCRLAARSNDRTETILQLAYPGRELKRCGGPV